MGQAAEQADLLTTGDMARLSGSTLRTVRFYEEAGLLKPVCRSGGGHRMFDRGELPKLKLILDLREACLSLNDIKELFDFKTQCASAKQASSQMAALLEEKVGVLQDKIVSLRGLREELLSTVAVIAECRGCGGKRFPLECSDCEILGRPDLPRAARLFWT